MAASTLFKGSRNNCIQRSLQAFKRLFLLHTTKSSYPSVSGRNAHLQTPPNNIYRFPIYLLVLFLPFSLFTRLPLSGQDVVQSVFEMLRLGQFHCQLVRRGVEFTLTIISGEFTPSTKPGALPPLPPRLRPSVPYIESILLVMSSTRLLTYFGVTASTPCSK